MNSQYERKSPEQLADTVKMLTQVAGRTETFTVFTEANLKALIAALSTLSRQTDQINRKMDTVMPAQELQAYLNQQVEVLQTRQNEFGNAVEWYIEEILKTAKKTEATLEKQAGNVSERFSSDCEKLVRDTQRSLDSITKTTELNLSNMMDHYRYELSDLVKSARRRLVTSSVLCWALTTLLAISYALAALLR